MLTCTDPLVRATVDDFLRMVAEAKRERNPIQALEDRLLDLRLAVG